jgi:selenocysteine lyase/cysteine desulfurase
LRFGLHAYNDESDIEKVIEGIREGLTIARRA